MRLEKNYSFYMRIKYIPQTMHAEIQFVYQQIVNISKFINNIS